MGNRTYAVITGTFLTVLIAALVTGVIWLRGPSSETLPYVVVSQQSVYGLMPQSTVFFRGVAAGTVESIGFDPGDSRNLFVRIDVNRNIPITRSTVAKLNLQGVTGLAQLELENTEANSQPLTTTRLEPARIPLRPSLLDQISANGADIVNQLNLLAGNLNKVLSETNQRHIRDLLENADTASTELVALERNLNRTAVVMPDVTQRTVETLGRIDGLLTDLHALSTTLQGLSQSGQIATDELNSQTLPRLNQTLYQLNQTAIDIHRLSLGLSDDPQRLLLGAQRSAPGPGEPGYKGSTP